jgi:hypothetical protein
MIVQPIQMLLFADMLVIYIKIDTEWHEFSRVGAVDIDICWDRSVFTYTPTTFGKARSSHLFTFLTCTNI